MKIYASNVHLKNTPNWLLLRCLFPKHKGTLEIKESAYTSALGVWALQSILKMICAHILSTLSNILFFKSWLCLIIGFYGFSCYLFACLQATSCTAYYLFLTLHLGITPSRTQKTICSARDYTRYVACKISAFSAVLTL